MLILVWFESLPGISGLLESTTCCSSPAPILDMLEILFVAQHQTMTSLVSIGRSNPAHVSAWYVYIVAMSASSRHTAFSPGAMECHLEVCKSPGHCLFLELQASFFAS